jgi:hypothetical protein
MISEFRRQKMPSELREICWIPTMRNSCSHSKPREYNSHPRNLEPVSEMFDAMPRARSPPPHATSPDETTQDHSLASSLALNSTTARDQRRPRDFTRRHAAQPESIPVSHLHRRAQIRLGSRNFTLRQCWATLTTTNLSLIWLEIKRGELESPQINPRALELWGNQELWPVIRDTRIRSHPTNALRDWPTEYWILDPRALRIHRIWYQMTHPWPPATRRRREHDKGNRNSSGEGRGPWTPRALLCLSSWYDTPFSLHAGFYLQPHADQLVLKSYTHTK